MADGTGATRRDRSARGLVGRFGLTGRTLLYWAGLLPAALAIGEASVGMLGADPVKALEHVFGLWSLRFLIAGLAVTPLQRHGGPRLMRYRRALGVLAFIYVALHVAVYAVLDQGLDLSAILADIWKRPYITVGLAAFLILLPLAATSTDPMVKRLGALAWRRLHLLVYPAVALAALHFVWLVKGWPAEPMVYAGLVALLLSYRLWWAIAGRKRPGRGTARGARRRRAAAVSQEG